MTSLAPWSDLPPAGHPIALQRSADLPRFPGYRALWLQSGTAALSAAMIAARLQRPDIVDPEIILPGYGCPDLVAAAEFAGVRAVLVDIGANDPAYDLSELAAALTPNTVAVVAVNFLGIRERLSELRRAAPGVALIEDNAQWFPEPVSALSADFVSLSFGRGKPVSLLGGGAVLIRETFGAALDSRLPVQPAIPDSASYGIKVRAYNALLQPWLYGCLSRNPAFKLGQTVFKPLESLQQMPETRRQLLVANVQIYLSRPRLIEAELSDIVQRNPRLVDLSGTAGERSGRLLRFPLLCADREMRDRLLSAMREAGLGATAMYKQALPQIEGVAQRVTVRGELVNAQAFADRLISLPTHAGVTPAHLNKLRTLLN